MDIGNNAFMLAVALAAAVAFIMAGWYAGVALFKRIAAGLVGRLGLVMLAALGASGCTILDSEIDRAAKYAGKAVTFYCDNVSLPQVREELRAKVNQHAAPNSIAVTCANGGPVLNSAEPVQ